MYMNVMHTEPLPGTAGMFMFTMDLESDYSTPCTTTCDGLYEQTCTLTQSHQPSQHDH